jgi:CBS domain-containing protein
MRVSDLHKSKRMKLQTVAPEVTVRDAAQQLVKHNIGALPVVDHEGDLVGIITERDILRLVAGDECHQMLERKVASVMTRRLITATPEEPIEAVMRTMTNNRIRHLPILEDGRLVDIISIGDVVKSQLDESSAEIQVLRMYVTT